MKKSPDVKEWIKVARKDWRRSLYMLEKSDIEAAGFFLQQSLEKFIKAFLIAEGCKLRKIHELDFLLDEAKNYNAMLGNFQDLCERVSGYYFADRYPPLAPLGLMRGDISKDLNEARAFIKTLFPGERLK